MLGSHKGSRSFSDGDGYLPSEGVGAVLLKPLTAAMKDQDRIYAVIKGSASLHGGRSNGFMTPSYKTQVNVIEQCLQHANAEPDTIGYIEAAANGSALGDPIEINALAKVFGKVENPIALGSVKSNLGHPEAASGIAQLTKVVLQLQHKQIAPLSKLGTINPNLQMENTSFHLCSDLVDWEPREFKKNGRSISVPKRALINSVGAGGSYVSMVIEEYSERRMQTEATDCSPPQLIILSAKNSERLGVMAKNLVDFLQREDAVTLPDIAYTLQVGRDPLPQRIAMVVGSRQELLINLKNYLMREQGGSAGDQSLAAPVYRGNAEDDYPKLESLISGPRGEEFISSLISDGDLERLGAFWAKGGKVPWRDLHKGHKHKIVSLPTYPFDHHRYWIGHEKVSEVRVRESAYDGNAAQSTVSSSAVSLNRYIVDFFSIALSLDADKIPIDKDLQNIGVDSILWSRLQRAIDKEFGIKLSSREILECNTIERLAEKLAGRLMYDAGSIHASEVNSNGMAVPSAAPPEQEDAKKKMLEEFKQGKIGLEDLKNLMREGLDA
jgi:polyketide synthase PksN